MAEVLRMHHAGLFVPKEKMEETIRFYMEVMGYELYYRGKYFDTEYVLLKLHDGTWLEIEDTSDIYPALEKDDRAIFEDVSYVVDDLKGFIRRAEKAGAKVTLPMEEAVFAEETPVYVARIKSPCGEELALMQKKEQESFDGQEDALMERLWACKEMCYDYNHLRPTQFEEQDQLIRKILGKTGEKVMVVAPFWCDMGCNIEVGENFFLNQNAVILDCGKVTFGDNAFIGPNCAFYTTVHPIDAERRNRREESAKPIHIGNNVWLGGGVQVMPGVSIGDNTVIAGGSVVTKNIPANVVAGGVPCKVIREITEEDRTRPL